MNRDGGPAVRGSGIGGLREAREASHGFTPRRRVAKESFLSLRLRGLARNITVEDHRRRILGECFAQQAARQHSSRDTPLPSPGIQELLAKMCHFWHNED